MCVHTSIDSLACPSQCYSSENYNMQCPVCSKVFNELADPLPFSHHAQSQLICAMSGEPINEHNPPMALPNGYIYGENVSARGSWLYAESFPELHFGNFMFVYLWLLAAGPYTRHSHWMSIQCKLQCIV